jgi:hypothetical protein
MVISVSLARKCIQELFQIMLSLILRLFHCSGSCTDAPYLPAIPALPVASRQTTCPLSLPASRMSLSSLAASQRSQNNGACLWTVNQYNRNVPCVTTNRCTLCHYQPMYVVSLPTNVRCVTTNRCTLCHYQPMYVVTTNQCTLCHYQPATQCCISYTKPCAVDQPRGLVFRTSDYES